MRAFRFDLLGDKRNGSVAPDRDSARRKATSAVSPNDEATVAFVDTGSDE